jgi:Fic family protein
VSIALSRFLVRFDQAYDPAHLSKVRQVVAIAAAHHRFLWIHPFYDGNGRVARLLSHAMLCRLAIGSRAVLSGQFERGKASSITGYRERMARGPLAKLMERGLFVSDGPKTPVRLGFPLNVVKRWFPALYPPARN